MAQRPKMDWALVSLAQLEGMRSPYMHNSKKPGVKQDTNIRRLNTMTRA